MSLERLAKVASSAANYRLLGRGGEDGITINWPEVVRAVLEAMRDNDAAMKTCAEAFGFEGRAIWQSAIDAILEGK